jgi:hypothetical protein
MDETLQEKRDKSSGWSPIRPWGKDQKAYPSATGTKAFPFKEF